MPFEPTHQAAVLGAVGLGHLTVAELAEHLTMSRASVHGALAGLLRKALLEGQPQGGFTLTTEGRLVIDEGRELRPRRYQRAKAAYFPNTLRQRAWNAMRIRRRFTVGDIALLAATDCDRRPENNIQAWFCRLARAGYLIERPTRRKGDAATSCGFKVWQLQRDTGFRAPTARPSKGDVYDHNNGEAYPCA